MLAGLPVQERAKGVGMVQRVMQVLLLLNLAMGENLAQLVQGKRWE